MQRRTFTASLTALASLAIVPMAQAAEEFTEGNAFKHLTRPVDLSAEPRGKVTVIEFFSYGCPHCSAFEPYLESWLKRAPADVALHRVPVPFLSNAVNFQRLYYALDAMKLVDDLQLKIFDAVHRDHIPLASPAEIIGFVTAYGADPRQFTAVFNSEAVSTKLRQSLQLMADYQIERVPTLGIQGKYVTSPAQVGNFDNALRVADFLIDKARKG